METDGAELVRSACRCHAYGAMGVVGPAMGSSVNVGCDDD